MTGILRRVRAYAGLFALLSALAFVAALLATGTPRVVNHLADRALRGDVTRLPHGARDVTLVVRPDTQGFPIDVPAAARLLDRYRSAMPAPLPGVIGQQWFAASVGPAGASTVVPAGPRTDLGLRVQTGVREAARLTTGRWPASTSQGRPEIAVSTAVATKLGLRPGLVLELRGGLGAGVDVLVVGVFTPLDPAAPVWDDMPLAVDTPWPLPDQPFRAVALTDEAGLASAAAGLDELVYTWRYRIDERRLDGDLVEPLSAAVAGVRRGPPSPSEMGAFIDPRIATAASSGLDAALARFAAQSRAARSLLTVVQAGLLATLLGLVALAAGLAVERRREEFALLRARGASVLRIGLRTLAEPLVVVPVAVLAGWCVGTLAPGRPSATGWLVVAIAALATTAVPLLATTSQRRVTFVARRRDLTRHRPSPRRVTGELVVLLLGVLGAYLLRRRGLGSAGVDPYLASVPVLLAAGAALVVLRLVPWPLGRLGRLAARSPGAVPFLGLTRAGRAAPLTAGPIAVLVIAITTGVFSGAVNTTIDATRDRIGELEIPADVRVAGAGLPVGTGDRLAAVPGVTAVTGMAVEPGASVKADRELGGQVLIVVVDPAGFARVAAASGVDVRLPAVLDSARAGQRPVPAVVSPAVATEITGTAVADLRGRPYEFTVAGVRDTFPGLEITTDRFVVLPAQALTGPGSAPVRADRFLIAGDGVDPAALTAAVDEARRAEAATNPALAIVPTPAEVTTHAARRTALDRTGANEVLTFTYLVGAAGGAALGLFAVGFAVLAGARPRGRALSRLRTMGLSRRQSRSLLAYELGPLVGVAALAGGLVGVLLPGLLAPALGLAQFTAGQAARIRLDPMLVGGLLALVAAALALAIVVENMINRRLRLNEVLRLGEENG
jgi:putative ABC transport system permease protein